MSSRTSLIGSLPSSPEGCAAVPPYSADGEYAVVFSISSHINSFNVLYCLSNEGVRIYSFPSLASASTVKFSLSSRFPLPSAVSAITETGFVFEYAEQINAEILPPSIVGASAFTSKSAVLKL